MSGAVLPAAAAADVHDLRDPQRTYTIAELSREYGVTPRTIRFYEDEGLITPRRQGLMRLYNAHDRTRLGWILRGKRLGFALAEIRQLLDLYRIDRTGVQQMRELLRRSRAHVAELERKRRDLDAQIAEFKDVEEHVAKELRRRGIDPDTD